MKLVTVRRFTTSMDAHLLRVFLEDEDIECFIFDGHMVDMNVMISNALGGVRLQVREEQAEKALKLIEEYYYKPYLDDNGNEIKCPKCSSVRLYGDFYSIKNPKGFLAFLTSIWFAAFPIYRKRVYRCKECDHEFDPKAEK